MQNGLLPKISKSRLILWIDLIIILLLSGSAMKVLFGWVSYLVFVPLLIHISELFNAPSKTSLPLIFTILMIFTTTILNINTTIYYYLLLLIDIIAVYCIAQKYTFKIVSDFYINIMTFIAGSSILLHFLVNNTNFGNSLPLLQSSNNITYRFMFVFVFRPDLIQRNHGPFWEPGIFASMLILCMLILAVRYNKNISKKTKRKDIFHLVILSAALFTTTSSAGIVLFGLFLIFFVVLGIKKRRSIFSTIGMWFSVVIVILLIINYQNLLEVFGLTNNNYFTRILSADSFISNSRFTYILNDLYFIFENPILGYGIVKSNNLIINGGGDTSTSLYTILVFGIFGLQYSFYFILAILRQRINTLAKFVLTVIVFLILNKEPHLQILISWLMLFLLLRVNTKKNINHSGELKIYKEKSDESVVVN